MLRNKATLVMLFCFSIFFMMVENELHPLIFLVDFEDTNFDQNWASHQDDDQKREYSLRACVFIYSQLGRQV